MIEGVFEDIDHQKVESCQHNNNCPPVGSRPHTEIVRIIKEAITKTVFLWNNICPGNSNIGEGGNQGDKRIGPSCVRLP